MKKTLLTLATLFTLSFTQLEAKPFLVDTGLPHYTKILMQKWDDTTLALSKEQKEKLLQVRKTTIKALKKLKPQIASLQKEIIQASKKGVDPKTLQPKLDQLAQLKKEASFVHLQCIYQTKKILKKEQLKMLQLR